MEDWLILAGLGGNLAAYHDLLREAQRRFRIGRIFVLGDVIAPGDRASNDALWEALTRPQRVLPEICLGWWEYQYLVLRGWTDENEATELLATCGPGGAKALWDAVSPGVAEGLYHLPLALNPLDALLVHGSPLNVAEALHPEVPPPVLYDRVRRTGARYLFCARAGIPFRYPIAGGTLHSTCQTLSGEAIARTYRANPCHLIGVGRAERGEYAVYNPGSDRLVFVD
ncbi:MAG: metallophosphatase [Pseudanabaenaceae cyanobacterium]